MNSITIGDLHDHTEQVVLRVADGDDFVITSQGRAIAVLRPASGGQARGTPLPRRESATLPATQADSTVFISEERGSG